MRHCTFWIILILLISVGTSFSEEKNASEILNDLKKRTPTIAIFPLENSNELAKQYGYGQAISSMLNTHLRNETNFMVLERSQLKSLIDEKALKELGVTRSTRSKLKSMHSVEVILTGETSYLNNSIQIDTRLISTETGQVVVAEYAVVKDQSELRAVVSELARTIEIKYLRQWMGNLKITSYPVDGEVYLDDQFIGKTRGGDGLDIENLLEGSYKLKVMSGGYKSHEGIIEIKPRTNRDIQVILETLPGKLSILSEPVGATVLLNNKAVGSTPLSLDNLEEGKYEVQLHKKNFQVWSEKINIQSGQLSEIKGLLEVIPGEISISSTPSKALVYIDDIKIGLTPLLIQNKRPGATVVRIVKPRYKVQVEQVTIKPGETTKIISELHKLKGKLTLVSGQSDVTAHVINIAGDTLFNKNALPIHKTPLDIGEYHVEMNKSGYYSYIDTITLEANKEVRIEKELKEKPAHITISNTGNTAIEIFIDGTYYGNLKSTKVELPRGDHEITISSIYKTETTNFSVLRDEYKTIEINHTESRFNLWTIPLSILAVISIIFLGGK